MPEASDICPICFIEISDQHETLICSHAFCKVCIDEWAKISDQCPVCRAKFVHWNITLPNMPDDHILRQSDLPFIERIVERLQNLSSTMELFNNLNQLVDDLHAETRSIRNMISARVDDVLDSNNDMGEIGYDSSNEQEEPREGD